MRIRSLCIAALVLSLYILPETRAQGCCTVGASSLGGLESGVQFEQTWNVGLGYQTNAITETYQGTERISDPLRRTAHVHYLTLQAEYGVLKGMSVLGSIHFSDKTRELTIATGSGSSRTDRTATFRGNGIGDLLLLMKFSVVRPTISEPTGVAVGIGASLPTGSFTQEQNGSQLSIDLQPGYRCDSASRLAFCLTWFPGNRSSIIPHLNL